MTSRARRIVLAMWGHKKPEPVAVTPPVGKPWIFAVVDSLPSRGCYEAMDDVEEWEIDNLTESEPYGVNLLASPIIGGNYGLPCA